MKVSEKKSEFVFRDQGKGDKKRERKIIKKINNRYKKI